MESTFRIGPSVCFEVQKITGVSIGDHGNQKTYQVQWAPTWISSFHLVGCEHLIEEFMHQQSSKGLLGNDICDEVCSSEVENLCMNQENNPCPESNNTNNSVCIAKEELDIDICDSVVYDHKETNPTSDETEICFEDAYAGESNRNNSSVDYNNSIAENNIVDSRSFRYPIASTNPTLNQSGRILSLLNASISGLDFRMISATRR